MKYIFSFFLLISLNFSNVYADDNQDNYDPSLSIANIYSDLLNDYNIRFSEGNFEESYVIASYLLQISPNSTDANFRLILAARELNIDVTSVIEDTDLSESNLIEKRFKNLAYAVFHSPNKRIPLKSSQEKKEQNNKIGKYFDLYADKFSGLIPTL